MTTEATTDSRRLRRVRDIFTTEEIQELTRRSDWRGAWAVFSNWAMIAIAFFVLARWPHPLTFLLALVVIAGRQLGLAILQHEASHHSLFKTKWLNEVLTDWLCARPVWQNLKKYREHHMRHHTHTGSDDDPDLTLHDGFPTTRRSLFRKFARDLIGYTGLKTILGLILMDAGVLRWTVANDIERLPQEGRSWYDYPLEFLRNAGGMLVTNGVLFGILWATGNPWLYGVWVLAYITPFPFFIRIRSIAEHACRPKVRDTFENTRSIRANWFWRLTVAPNRVNYHREHHLLSAVPYYRLPQMHRMLRDKGLVEEPPSYVSVLKQASAGA